VSALEFIALYQINLITYALRLITFLAKDK